MNTEHARPTELIIVDLNYAEYQALVIALLPHGIRIRFFATGGDAMRAFGNHSSTLWIVNTQLPDMSGIGLLSLIRCRLRRCRVFLVSDHYCAEDERAARSAGATAYVCKPASAAWLNDFLPRCRSLAIRAGPGPFD
jgi:DNA-binding response OmpR family regulator